MIYAQILSGSVQNLIVLTDTSLIPSFSAGFDYFIEIDTLIPMPGIGWSYDGTNFTGPTPPTVTPAPLNQQYTPEEYGQLLINQFTAANKERDLTSTQVFALAQNLGPYYILLQCGSLQAFLDNLSNIPVDGLVITSAIITEFNNAVSAYLAGD